MGMKQVPDVIETNSEAALETKITAISSLNLHENEENWDKIENSLKVLAAVTNGGGYKHSIYLEILRNHSEGFLRALNSERSRVMSAAVDCLSIIAPRLGSLFDSFCATFIPTLLKLTSKSTKIYVVRAKKCLITIISSTRLPSIIPHLRNAYSDKAQSLRLAVVEGLLTAIESYDTQSLKSRITDIETIMRACATDSNADVRAISKRIYGLYTLKFVDRVDQFTDPLTPTIRKYLQIAPRNANQSKKPSLPPAPAQRPQRERIEHLDTDNDENEPLSSSTGGPLRPTQSSASTSNTNSDTGAVRFSKSTSAAQSAQSSQPAPQVPPLPSRSLSSSTQEQRHPTTATSGPSRVVSQPTKPASSSSKSSERPRSTTPTATTGARRPISKLSGSSSGAGGGGSGSSSTVGSSTSGPRRPAAGIGLRKTEQKASDQPTSSTAGYTRFAVKPLQSNGKETQEKPTGRTMAAGVRAKILNIQERNSLKKQQSESSANKDEDYDSNGGKNNKSKDIGSSGKDEEKDTEKDKVQEEVEDKGQKARRAPTKSTDTKKDKGTVGALKEKKNEKGAPTKVLQKRKVVSSRPNAPPNKPPPAGETKAAKPSRITKPPVPKVVPARRKAAPSSQLAQPKPPTDVAEKAKDIPLPQADEDELSDLFAGFNLKANQVVCVSGLGQYCSEIFGYSIDIDKFFNKIFIVPKAWSTELEENLHTHGCWYSNGQD
ncbi:CLIP-associating protein 1 [Wallemia ichthyophaga EXF-994]|uniref:CLIP-associating protein 1 n=1 Tax=Wallemia ichthyophaga (strain EXF-994 / CBS 113033) TaxID=1299270 RepID=R9AEP8_WALI9|nr:CLIP-associating protein 1 [Wallemia ichthyophaga EXF-994]EOR00647.1 CLIP-associating protein 1 [Wallemia ichthyophaga EXF-994]